MSRSSLFAKRPSPAMVLAVVALVFAMVGTAIAGSDAISSKITKSKVKSIAKKQINKAAPGLSVSHAQTADNATNAQNADAVDGQSITKVNYRANAPSAGQTIFDAGGLSISAACAAPGNDVSVTATTTKTNSSIYSFVGSDGDPTNPTEADLEGGGFSPGVNFDLLAGGNGNINFVHFEYDALDGTIATGTLAIDENGIQHNCLVTGNVISG